MADAPLLSEALERILQPAAELGVLRVDQVVELGNAARALEERVALLEVIIFDEDDDDDEQEGEVLPDDDDDDGEDTSDPPTW